MPLAKARQDLTDARTEIVRLRLEVARLEHALSTAANLSILLTPIEAIFDRTENTLTERENEILLLIMAGATVDQIAGQIYVSRSTVKAHIRHLYKKVGVHNRGGAAMAGVHLGLEVPPEEQTT